MNNHFIVFDRKTGKLADVYSVDGETGKRMPKPDLRSEKERRGERRLALAIIGVKKQ